MSLQTAAKKGVFGDSSQAGYVWKQQLRRVCLETVAKKGVLGSSISAGCVWK